MKNRLTVYLLIVISIILVGCSAEDEKTILSNKKIVCYGDSITWGEINTDPKTSDYAWPTVLGEMTGANVVNEGISGSAMAFVSDEPEDSDLNRDSCVYRLQHEDITGYDYILIAYGANDLNIGIPIGENEDTTPYTFKGAVNCAIKAVREQKSDIEIIMITPLPDYHNDSGYRDAVLEMAEYNNVACVDLYQLNITEEDYYSVFWDHVLHPNDATYYAIGTYIATYLSTNESVCHKIKYDSQGGHITIQTSLAVEGQKIGKMLTTVKHGYKFEGWYTQPENGDLVTEDTIYDFENDITLYDIFQKGKSIAEHVYKA